MKKIHEVSTCSATWIPHSFNAAHKTTHYQFWWFVSYVLPLWLCTGIAQSVYYGSRNEFPHYLAHYSHFYCISHLSSSITGEVRGIVCNSASDWNDNIDIGWNIDILISIYHIKNVDTTVKSVRSREKQNVK